MATDYSDALLDEMGKLQEKLDHSNAWDLDAQLEQAMDALGCPPGDWQVTTLSGGEKRRVALCKLLLEAPDLKTRAEILVAATEIELAKKTSGGETPLQ